MSKKGKQQIKNVVSKEIENVGEIKVLKEELREAEKKILGLYKTLEEYGIDEYSPITDVEYICTKGILDLKAIADGMGLTQDDAKTLDILHKNLRMARGKIEVKEPKGKAQTVEQLLRIVEGEKK